MNEKTIVIRVSLQGKFEDLQEKIEKIKKNNLDANIEIIYVENLSANNNSC